MKKIFTLLFAVLTATGVMAQAHGALKFVGQSNIKVATMSTDNESDTIQFLMSDMTSGDITLPEMKGMQTIPSFTISGAQFSMGANHVVTFADQTFSSTVNVNGEEKTIAGSSLSGTYNMADNSLTLTVVFKYGSMPMSLTYNVKGYYVKAVSNQLSVTVGGMYTYTNDNVTYNVRKYVDGDVEKLDVEVPEYTLDGTIMGDLTLGSYVIKGLVYDESRGGFWRDYKDDGLSFHFKAVSGGQTTMDNDYTFNSSKDNNILVAYEGNNVSSIVNTFQMGAMPFSIVSTFGGTATAVSGATLQESAVINNDKAYNLAGQRVAKDAKGIVVIGGKKYLNR